MAKIFAMAVLLEAASTSSQMTPLKLGKVCSQWHGIASKITAIHHRVSLSLNLDLEKCARVAVSPCHSLPMTSTNSPSDLSSWIHDIHWNLSCHTSAICWGWLCCPHSHPKLHQLIAMNSTCKCVCEAIVAGIFAYLVNVETNTAVPFMPVLDGPNGFITHYLSQLYAKGHFI